MAAKRNVKKDMGLGGEWLVAGELTLAGIPVKMAPTNFPNYDLIGRP